MASHWGATGAVSLLMIACKGGDDLLVRIDDDVKDESQPGLLRGKDHVLVDGVFVQAALTSVWALQETGVVVVQHCFGRGNAGQDGLATARETRKEMRLDEAFGHNQVAFLD